MTYENTPSFAAAGAAPDGAASPARSGPPKAVWFAIGACALAGVGAASTLVWKGQAARNADAARTPVVAAAQSLSAREEVVDAPRAGARPAAPDDGVPEAPRAKAAARSGDQGGVQRLPAPGAKVAGGTATAAAACANCGVIESVQAVQKKGQATGVGAVAGTVLGGVVGNQFGGGDGKKAMTVIGAVGGGMAGHEVEKRARGTTVYKVTVRMDDGSLRSIEQAQAPAVGTRVRVNGQSLQRS